VFYSVSAVSGPVAVIGLAYGCVPILAPLLSQLAGTDDTEAMRARHWLCLMLAFVGNAMVFRELEAAQIRFTTAAAFAFLAGLLFTLLPVCSAKLQQAGLGTWAVLKAQGAVAATLSVPMLALLIALGWVGMGQSHGVPLTRSVEVGAMNAVAFTTLPFYLWYRGIERCGVARTSILRVRRAAGCDAVLTPRAARCASDAHSSRRSKPRHRRDRGVRAVQRVNAA
jgi:drug/metabolite transporter (DMT)-like permease